MAVNVGKGFKLSGSFDTNIRWEKVEIFHHFEFKVRRGRTPLEGREPEVSKFSGNIGCNENLLVDRTTQVDDSQRLKSLLTGRHQHKGA